MERVVLNPKIILLKCLDPEISYLEVFFVLKYFWGEAGSVWGRS